MDFNLTNKQEEIRGKAREFAEAELAPKVRELERQAVFPRDIYRRISELGMGAGTIFPAQYGGVEAGHLARMLANIEISKAYGAMGLALQTIPVGLWAVLHFGTEEQKRKYIPPVISGDKVACLALTEPMGGSDPGSTTTTAKRSGDEYVVNGSKVFITLASESDFCVFAARTGEEPGGISMFLVDKGTEGFIQGPCDEREGLRAAGVGGVAFKNCRIPKENLLGKEGQALRTALKCIFEVGRPGNAAMAIGIAEAAFERTLKFVKDRKLYGGKALSSIQSIQFALANMCMELEASKLMAYRSAWLLDQGKTSMNVAKELSMAKVYTSEAAKRIAMRAVSLLGGYGTLPGFDVIRYLRDSLETDAAAGTNAICKIVIGRELTGIFSLGG